MMMADVHTLSTSTSLQLLGSNAFVSFAQESTKGSQGVVLIPLYDDVED